MNQLYFLLPAVVLLTGCASAPLPIMSDSDYKKAAQALAGINMCGEAGYIDPATASLGIRYLTADLGNSYHSNVMDLYVDAAKAEIAAVTKEDCNMAAMRIADRKQQIQYQNEVYAQDREEIQKAIENRPRQTSCSTFGTQTLCNTY